MSDESTAVLYIITGFRDAMTELSNNGDFHAKVILHHFFQQDSKVKYDSVLKTAGATLMIKHIKDNSRLAAELAEAQHQRNGWIERALTAEVELAKLLEIASNG